MKIIVCISKLWLQKQKGGVLLPSSTQELYCTIVLCHEKHPTSTTNNQVTLCVRPSPPRSKCTLEKMLHIKVVALAATMIAFEDKNIMGKSKCQASYLSCMELKTKYSLGHRKCEIRGSSKISVFKVCYKYNPNMFF